MKIVLINAGVKRVSTEYYPPLGIGYLASTLRMNGYVVNVVDMMINREKNVYDEIKEYDVVGIYFNMVNVPEAIEIAEIAKRMDKIVILGGPHASFNYQECFEKFKVDYIIVGEGEKAIISLLQSFKGEISLENVKSLVYKKHNKLIVNPIEDLIENLDLIPFPARDLLAMEEYRKYNCCTSIIASRGCPYHCSFCAGVLMGRNRYRRRSVFNVINEMEEVINVYGFNSITFFDDIFTLDKRFVLDLCAAIKNKGWNIGLSCETRVDAVDKEMLEAMSEVGFDSIFFGIESGCQRILDSYNKNTDVEGIKNAVNLCKINGISPQLSFIIGLPEDREESIRETIDLANSLDVKRVWFQPFSPFPGTKAYDECIENGLLTEASIDYEKYNLRSVVVGTKYLSKQDVAQLYLEAIRSVYAR